MIISKGYGASTATGSPIATFEKFLEK